MLRIQRPPCIAFHGLSRLGKLLTVPRKSQRSMTGRLQTFNMTNGVIERAILYLNTNFSIHNTPIGCHLT
jgi:hypothetical protein